MSRKFLSPTLSEIQAVKERQGRDGSTGSNESFGSLDGKCNYLYFFVKCENMSWGFEYEFAESLTQTVSLGLYIMRYITENISHFLVIVIT